MIKIPYDDLLTKICEKSSLSKEQVEEKISQKLKQLAGLISKEGAAHIVANELGVKLLEQTNGKLKIKNILAGMRSVETLGAVQRIFETRSFETNGRSGKVASLNLGDETGIIRVVAWGDQTNTFSELKEGSILKLIGGYVRENQGRLEVHVNDKSRLIVNPIGESVSVIKREDADRKSIVDLKETDQNVELFGTLVQIYDPRFYEVCPTCNKRVKQQEIGFVCDTHGSVTPSYSYVLNAMIDDGTETIRAVFFKNQAERLFGVQSNALLALKDSPEQFEEAKLRMLGTMVKIIGKVSKNQMFDRLEFVSNLVFPSPSATDELKRLQESPKSNIEKTQPKPTYSQKEEILEEEIE